LKEVEAAYRKKEVQVEIRIAKPITEPESKLSSPPKSGKPVQRLRELASVV
jgi:hypothetical protein